MQHAQETHLVFPILVSGLQIVSFDALMQSKAVQIIVVESVLVFSKTIMDFLFQSAPFQILIAKHYAFVHQSYLAKIAH